MRQTHRQHNSLERLTFEAINHQRAVRDALHLK